MPGGDRRRPHWGRYYSLGFEFAAAVGGFVLLGYWIDRHYETSPRGILICTALGLIGGTYNFVRSALRELRRDAAARGDTTAGKEDRKDRGA